MINIIISIIGLIISIVAISLTYWQINLSNRHSMFEKRLENYRSISSLLQSYELISSDINTFLANDSIKLSKYFAVDLSAKFLGTPFFQSIIPSNFDIFDPETLYILDNENIVNSINQISSISTFLYKEENSIFISEFLNSYALLIRYIYIYLRYENLIQKTNKHVEKNPLLHHRIENEKKVNEYLIETQKKYNLFIENHTLTKIENEIKIIGLGKNIWKFLFNNGQ